MARKSLVAKQRRRERLVQLNWDKRQKLKAEVIDLNKTPEERFAAQMKLNSITRNASPVRLRNRCQLTGRSRGFLRKFKLSRLCFREMANNGLIPGVVKASW